MAYLNQFLSAQELAHLSDADRDFLVQRIDHVLDTHPDVRARVADGLKDALGSLGHAKISIRNDQLKAATF